MSHSHLKHIGKSPQASVKCDCSLQCLNLILGKLDEVYKRNTFIVPRPSRTKAARQTRFAAAAVGTSLIEATGFCACDLDNFRRGLFLVLAALTTALSCGSGSFFPSCPLDLAFLKESFSVTKQTKTYSQDMCISCLCKTAYTKRAAY